MRSLVGPESDMSTSQTLSVVVLIPFCTHGFNKETLLHSCIFVQCRFALRQIKIADGIYYSFCWLVLRDIVKTPQLLTNVCYVQSNCTFSSLPLPSEWFRCSTDNKFRYQQRGIGHAAFNDIINIVNFRLAKQGRTYAYIKWRTQ